MAVPIAPNLAGLFAVVLVRILLWDKKQSIIWNIAVMFLAMAATFVTLDGSTTSTFFGFWMGIGYAGMGVGIVALGKNMALTTIKDRFGAAVSVFMGVKPEPPAADPPPEDPVLK